MHNSIDQSASPCRNNVAFAYRRPASTCSIRQKLLGTSSTFQILYTQPCDHPAHVISCSVKMNMRAHMHAARTRTHSIEYDSHLEFVSLSIGRNLWVYMDTEAPPQWRKAPFIQGIPNEFFQWPWWVLAYREQKYRDRINPYVVLICTDHDESTD